MKKEGVPAQMKHLGIRGDEEVDDDASLLDSVRKLPSIQHHRDPAGVEQPRELSFDLLAGPRCRLFSVEAVVFPWCGCVSFALVF